MDFLSHTDHRHLSFSSLRSWRPSLKSMLRQNFLIWGQDQWKLWRLHSTENIKGVYRFLMYTLMWDQNIWKKWKILYVREKKFQFQWKFFRTESFLRINEFCNGGIIISFTDNLNQWNLILTEHSCCDYSWCNFYLSLP